MGNELINRVAAITVGLTGQPTEKYSGLRIKFAIKKTVDSTGNTAKITIYNLPQNIRGLLERGKPDDGIICILDAGYQIATTIFKGEVHKSKSERKGPDWVTTIEAVDGKRALEQATLSKGYPAGTDIKDVVTDAANAMKEAGDVIIGTIESVKSEIAENGLTVDGLASVIMDGIMNDQDQSWSIQDGEIETHLIDGDVGEQALSLSASTGLLTLPIRREDGNIEFMALMRPEMSKPGKLIEIADVGFIVVQTIDYKGDTHSNEWSMKGVGKPT